MAQAREAAGFVKVGGGSKPNFAAATLGLYSPKTNPLSAPSSVRRCPGGGIGRHTRLRGVCRKACRFESCPGHQLVRVPKSANWGTGRDANSERVSARNSEAKS